MTDRRAANSGDNSPQSAAKAQALRLRRFLIASATYVLAILVVALGVGMGVLHINVLVVYTALVVGANLVFYLILRSGLNQKFPDPSLTSAQITMAIVALMYVAYNAGPARGIVMLWVLMIFMFAVFRLRSNHLWPLAILAWIAYGGVVGLLIRNQGQAINFNLELFQWIVLGGVLTWFSFMGGYVSNLRHKLRQNEMFYRSLSETAPDAILIVGPTGQVEYANTAVQSIFGREPKAVIGTALTKLVGTSGQAERLQAFRAYMEGAESTLTWNAAEIYFVHENGSEFPAEVSIDEMLVDGRRICLLFVHNIAARKRSEQALVAARETAEAASRAKTQFLANMTHEMRTPMNGIIGMAEILQQEKLSPTARGYVETIHRSGRALLGVVNDVLDFSKMETGQLDMERAVFDLPKVLHEVHDLYAESARAKQIAMFWNVPRTLPPMVFGDPSRLRQILSNLVSNAVKFTESGSIALHVSLEAQDKVCFEISDTGIGIPPEQQAAIFEAFMQVDGSATRRFGGTGLGLTVARQIVTLMGGDIGVRSEPGKGSCFWFTVPLPRATQRAAPAPEAPASDDQFSGTRILLVEDDESNAEIAMILLEQFGPVITHAANGALAVAAFRDARFDLVFMDCQMPVMDGFEATRQMRAIEKTDGSRNHTPIVALTAHAFAGYREECIAVGMDDYMTKPVSTDDFRSMLSRWAA